MNYIKSVEIFGFWRTKKVQIKFREDLNFLIGPNGSGKTTIINLVAAALKADIPVLYSLPFTKIVIRLKVIGANRVPIIEVTKSVDEKMGSLELIYVIKENSSDKGKTYGVEGPFDERLYRGASSQRQRRRLQEEGAQLTSIIAELVEVNWLSIHRASFARSSRQYHDEFFETTIDQKLHEISQKFASYFSLLSTSADEEIKIFQEYIFLSLLDRERSSSEVLSADDIDPEEKSNLAGVLKDLGVAQSKAKKSARSHYTKLSKAKRKLQETHKIDLDDAITLSDASRIRNMISEWRNLNEKRAAIFKPRTQFEAIINRLFSGKDLRFDPRNLPKVRLQSEEEVDINILSSGEKQLFILLGETLLQENRPVVFISDEPELSLHVKWQSSLFKNVRELNSSSQIISATHSPDIVGSFQGRVIKVESCISDV